MRIKVERVYSQTGDKFRLTFPDGSREVIVVEDGGGWTRVQSKQALDIAEHLYRAKRSNVRFIHH